MVTIAGGIVLGVIALGVLGAVLALLAHALGAPGRRRDNEEMGRYAREQSRREELLREMTREESDNYRTWGNLHGPSGPNARRLPSLSPAALEMDRLDAEKDDRFYTRLRARNK
jgi:hypothetical protein